MEKKIINHVISKDLNSNIFKSLFNYFEKYGNFKYIVTEKPIKNAFVYHYHRFFLESTFPENSIATLHFDTEDYFPSILKYSNLLRKFRIITCLNNSQAFFLRKENFNYIKIEHGYNAIIKKKKNY